MKTAFLIITILIMLVFAHGLIKVESEIKSGVVRMDGKIYSCQEWDYYPTKGKKK